MADTYLGINASAAVNLADGTVAYLDKGAKLPSNLATGELDRLKAAGTPLFSKPQSRAPFVPPPPTSDEVVDEAPTLTPSGEPATPPAASVAEALAAATEGKQTRSAKG